MGRSEDKAMEFKPSMKCDKHPRYKVIRKPKPGCVICHAMWQEKLVWLESQPLTKYQRADLVLQALREQCKDLDDDDAIEVCDEVEDGAKQMRECLMMDWDSGPNN
jgi:hypothetical protein